MNDYAAGSTSVVETVWLQDSASAVGAGKTALAYNTAGLICYYKRSSGGASVPVSLAPVATLGTFVSGGFREIDATNCPGLYEFHPPDAALAAGAKWVAFFFVGAAGMVQRVIKVRLVGVNPDDATSGGISGIADATSAAQQAASAAAGVPAAVWSFDLASVTAGIGAWIKSVLAYLSPRVTFTTVVAPDGGKIALKQGDDHLQSLGRAVNIPVPETAPDLSAATFVLGVARAQDSVVVLECAGELIPDEDSRTLRFEPLHGQTELLPAAVELRFDALATWEDGRRYTVCEGAVVVSRRRTSLAST